MPLTKGQVVSAAYELIGLDGAGTDLINKAIPQLERMMRTWWNEFIDTGYSFSTTVSAATSADDSKLTPYDEDAVILNFAVKLATINAIAIGGTLLTDAKTAKTGKYSLIPIPTAQNPFMPLGAGNVRNGRHIVFQGEGTDSSLLTYGGNPLEGGT
jgi:hypothetical protein